MGGDIRYPYEQAIAVAKELVAKLESSCDRVAIVGSLRRRKAEVGDVELLLIPKWEELLLPGEMFTKKTNLLEASVTKLLQTGQLEFRMKSDGTIANGTKVKLLRHSSGLPVDLFMTSPKCWYSSLLCRTGGKKNNATIASLAIRKGYRWEMAGEGFVGPEGVVPITSEESAYSFVGMPYLPPTERS